MARRPSNLGRFFTNIKNTIFSTKQKATLVGVDHLGNKYFEKEADPSRNLSRKRYIEETSDHDMSHFPEIPVEWEAWLRGRRRNPPTQEELMKNMAKIKRTQMRAAEIDQKYDTEKKAAEPVIEEKASAFGEKVSSNQQKSEFPVYEEYERIPGKSHKGFREN